VRVENHLTGSYTLIDDVTSSAVSTHEVSSNHSLTVTLDTAASSLPISRTTGNEITGEFSTSTATLDNSTANETDVNTGRLVFTADYSTSGTDHQENGNTITGATTISDTTTSSATHTERDLNQTAVVSQQIYSSESGTPFRPLAHGRRNHGYWTTSAPFLDDFSDDLCRRTWHRDEGCGVCKSGIGNGLRRAQQTPLLVDGRLGRLVTAYFPLFVRRPGSSCSVSF
jgi:hypothetical protein